MVLRDRIVIFICCNPDGLKAWTRIRRHNAVSLSVEDFEVNNNFDWTQSSHPTSFTTLLILKNKRSIKKPVSVTSGICCNLDQRSVTLFKENAFYFVWKLWGFF